MSSDKYPEVPIYKQITGEDVKKYQKQLLNALAEMEEGRVISAHPIVRGVMFSLGEHIVEPGAWW